MPSTEQIRLDCMKSYQESIQTGRENLKSIVKAIISAHINDIENQSCDVLIPFSKHCLYSFTSQLRSLLPHMGAISIASLNESLNETDLFDLITPKSYICQQSQRANLYETQLKKLPSPSPLDLLSGFKQSYYQYKR